MVKMEQRKNSKGFEKKKTQLIKVMERAINLSEELAQMQIKRGSSPIHATAKRWVGWEINSLLHSARSLNE